MLGWGSAGREAGSDSTGRATGAVRDPDDAAFNPTPVADAWGGISFYMGMIEELWKEWHRICLFVRRAHTTSGGRYSLTPERPAGGHFPHSVCRYPSCLDADITRVSAHNVVTRPLRQFADFVAFVRNSHLSAERQEELPHDDVMSLPLRLSRRQSIVGRRFV
jgi:hypothetical protein